jgi:transposase
MSADVGTRLIALADGLRNGVVPDDAPARRLLLEAVEHLRRCGRRRGGVKSSERRGLRRARTPHAEGHGRRGADDYRGAERVEVAHPDLASGGSCPTPGCAGRLHQEEARSEVELQGSAPIRAIAYVRECLRCALCATSFPAPLPPTAQGTKYDASADATLAVARYELGLPHHRLAQWQEQVGVPVPAATQFERVELMANDVLPAYREMEKQAANAAVLFTDDTAVNVLSLKKQIAEQPPGQRTGLNTTVLVAQGLGAGDPSVVLYRSGRQHAGENLDDLLRERTTDAPPVIHMADGASRDPAHPRRAAHCWAHARRYFIEIQAAFAAECGHVLDVIGAVFARDALAHRHGLSPEARLRLHQEESGPALQDLRDWMEAQFAERRVEPNSALGKAFAYVKNQWPGLTLFLRVAGVPLDNNLAERQLKSALRHRRNSLFFRNEAGAAVADVLMSAIRTCVVNNRDPIHYLTAVRRHAARVREAAAQWLPTTYEDSLRRLRLN